MFSSSKQYAPPLSLTSSKLHSSTKESQLLLVNFYILFGDAFRRADGTRGTDETTEMTANTTRANKVRLTQVTIESDGLMAAVLTGSVAATAADAFLSVEGGIHDGVSVEVGGGIEIRQLLAHQL